MSKRRVAYYYDPDIGSYSYGLGHPMKPFRMRLTHNLVSAYDMLPKMDVIRPERATPLQMTRFHSDEYVDFLHRVTPEIAQDMSGGGSRFLTGEDNPAFDGLFEFCSISAGGSLAAADRINSGMADIAINWAGGLHHAKKGEASGFCYINDIVLGILELLRLHTRVLYIDIDCHHGDGVEEAFYTTDRVLTCSFHKQKDYFPGTGKVEDRGLGKGFGYSVNVPLLNGITDDEYKSVFEPVIQYLLGWYQPDVVVLQCGADSLSGDKLGCFNISMNGHADCVRFLRATNIPLVLLGGGGYTTRNVSSVWTYETACALGIDRDIDLNLPYNEYLEWYGPRYRLEVQPSNMTDDNNHRNYLETTKQTVLEALRDLPFAPSVGSHAVPRNTVAQETGLTRDNDLEEDELDVQIRRRVHEALRSREAASYEEDEGEVDSSESEELPYTLAGSSRNMYQTTYQDESDEDVDISSDDDQEQSGFQHTNAPPNLSRRLSAIHRGRGRPLQHPQPPQQYHGTRAAVAATRAPSPPKRLFFSHGASAPVIRRPRLWDGTPIYDGPLHPSHPFRMSGVDRADIVMAAG